MPPASNVNSQAVNAPQANVPVEPPPEEELVDEAAKPIRRERPKEPTRRERERSTKTLATPIFVLGAKCV